MCTLHLIQLKCVDKQTLIGKDKIDVYVRGDRVAGPPQPVKGRSGQADRRQTVRLGRGRRTIGAGR